MSKYPKRLELECKCLNIAVRYVAESILWGGSNSEFQVVQDGEVQIAHYRAWEDNVEPEGLREAKKGIEQKVEQFVLAMRFLGNLKFHQTDYSWSYFMENGEECHIVNDMDIEAIILRSRGESYCFVGVELDPITFCGTVSTSPAPLPQYMPSVPLILKRHILNMVQAEELDYESGNYEDEQLKRWFLVIEELEGNKSSSDYKELRCARNFVSHGIVDRSDVLAFLKKELPLSVIENSSGEEEARYLRDDPNHRAVVSKYHTIARSWARRLIEEEILQAGGYLRP